MATTQFAMVEELASLIKDNLYSKHLVLSTEEALVNFLQDGTSVDVTLELQPVGSYHRLLLHRLADIYGFAHESIGEGDDRHLVLERCPETAIPPVLVSDILWQYDDDDTSTSHPVLRRSDSDFQGAVSVEGSQIKADMAPRPLQSSSLSAASLEEREAAYQAARDRIFALDDSKEKGTAAPKSRQVPDVARRMIAHALGKKICSPTETTPPVKGEWKKPVKEPNFAKNGSNDLYPGTPDTTEVSYVQNGNSSSLNGKSYGRPSNQNSHTANGRVVSAENLKKEQIGAAKRIFAHALGLPSGQGSHVAVMKPN